MAVSVLLCSSVTAFADTTVDSGGNYDKSFFQNLINSSGCDIADDLSLSQLPSDDYLVIIQYTKQNGNSYIHFIPKSKKKYVFLKSNEQNYQTDVQNYDLKNDEILITSIETSNGYGFIVTTNFKSYILTHNDSQSRFQTNENGISYNHYPNFLGSIDSTPYQYANHFFFNDSTIFNNLIKNYNPKTYQQSLIAPPDGAISREYSSTDCVPSLFSYLTQIIPGYTGAIYDSSLEHIIDKNGKPCDDTIIDKYKYQIYYSLNNDLRYVFLNNAYEPKYTKDKIQGTKSEIAYKYKFTYQKSSDCIVYFPTFQMYLPYDDWYSFQPKDNDFKWFWEDQTDNKSFNLFSDWTYENGNYIGSRVSLSWEQNNQLGENADFISLSQFITDKDKLLNNGWIKGRPTDTSYPYCIEIDYNGQAGLFIYSNSKPTISKIDIQSDNYKKFEIYMVGMYGYVYNAINDVYINYDFTIKDGQKNFVQQYLFKYFSYQLHCLDNDLNLTLYENYKGTDTDYKGTRVFFNWDITQDKRLGISDEQMQKLQENCKEDIGGFLDENGNNHGGNLNNYTDEDKNKFNESGSNSSNTLDNSFDFTFDGIINYCDEFFSFIQTVFGLFPAFIWVLVGASIAVLIALRVIGR